MSNIDERQPLLPPAALESTPALNDRSPSYNRDEENQNEERQPAEESAAEEVKQKRSWWSIAWYTLLTGLGIFFAVLFIKGFIDADDVEVCTSYRQHYTTGNTDFSEV